MRAQAQDPYARPRRALLPMLRALLHVMAHALAWQVRAAAALGWLDQRGAAARWLDRELGRLEHGLRCMLILLNQQGGVKTFSSRRQLRCVRAPHSSSPPSGAAPPLSSRFGGGAGETGPQSSTFGETGEVGPRICDAQARLGGDDMDGIAPNMAAHAFSLTLAAFGWKAQQTKTGSKLVSHPKRRKQPQPDLTPAHRLAARINAVLDALGDLDHHTARMARRIAVLGLRIKRLAPIRPVPEAVLLLAQALTTTPAPRLASPAPDTS